MTDKYTKRLQGFTLVELSIVIIIIGFLIAGIAAGQSLIKQAAITSTIADYGNYVTSVHSFKIRYGYLPGDIPIASSYWPAAINGNNDKFIEPFIDSVLVAENLQAWNHLSSAGMINGNYPAGGTIAKIGVYNPKSSLSDATGFDFDYWPAYGGRTGHAMVLGGIPTGVPHVLNGGSISPEDAALMDKKMDDGMPGTGFMFVLAGTNVSSGHCVNQSGNTINFIFTDTTKSCLIWFYFDLYEN